MVSLQDAELGEGSSPSATGGAMRSIEAGLLYGQEPVSKTRYDEIVGLELKLRRQRLLKTALNWVVAGIGHRHGAVAAQELPPPIHEVARCRHRCSWLPAVRGVANVVSAAILDVGDSVTYESLDRIYADEFALRNFGAVTEAAR